MFSVRVDKKEIEKFLEPDRIRRHLAENYPKSASKMKSYKLHIKAWGRHLPMVNCNFLELLVENNLFQKCVTWFSLLELHP